ncbi:MAG: GNAT family N-acetyltransferase [Acidimicrobiia bacterium]|nr:GNAT family N-acetyltransferase [Acidimicrobiia bacterium]
MNQVPKVVAVRSFEADAAAAVLANAFADDPIFRYILGDRNDIERRAKHLFVENIAAELRKSAHLVEMTEDGNAVALWHDVDDWRTPPVELVRSLPSTVRAFGMSLPRALRVLLTAEKVHPPEPHRHLAYIGTHDDHKGKGLGTALLADMTERCDQNGLAAYLESTNPVNDAWYARFGFESRGPVPLPSGAPVLTAMWRDPR